MRIGLDLRFLVLGRQNAVRGIPRFTLEQLQSVLALDTDNTYLLLCNPGDDLDAIRPEIRAAPNAHIVCAPAASGPVFGPGDDGTLLAGYGAYQRWLDGLRLDLYHSTCHFWVSRLILPGFDVCPYVVTSYDLMPLLYPAHIASDPAAAYQLGLLFLEQATRIAAISQATADALVEHLGVQRDRIDLTPPAISPCFRVLRPEVTRSILTSLDHPARRFPRCRVHMPADYVLSVTDMHYTKNLPTLLAGYAQLPPATRSRFPLVIAGQLRDVDVGQINQRAQRLGITSNLMLTGRVSDHELMALYNGATLMVHPSHHEGFGLTVAEAMRCGTPVITTTRSALPEVTGDAALLVDSEDASAFAEAIARLLGDRELRNDLRSRGPAQVARYTTEALGQATLDCYRKAVSGAPAANTVRVALWTPVPPQASGAADYADDLVTELAADAGLSLDVFVDDGVVPPLELMQRANVHHWSDFERCARRAGYDAVIYQLGGWPFQRYMEPAMVRHPGIAVLHDPECSGAHPMLETVDNAACCVAMTAEAASVLQRRYPNVEVQRIPVGARDPCQNGQGFDRAIARGYLGLDPDAFVVVASGPVDATKHLQAVVEAFAELRQTVAQGLLAVVGWTPDPAYASALRSRAQDLGIDDAFTLTGPVSRTVFDAYTAACDVVVTLRDPRPGHVPAAVVRALAAGRCIVMSDVPALAWIPDSACIRLGAHHERTGLAAGLSVLAGDPMRRRDLEREARAVYMASAQLDPMVEGYMRLIRAQAGVGRKGPVAASVSVTRAGRAGRPAPRTGPLPYNKMCELEDFAHADLRDVLREVAPHKRAVFGGEFPRGYEHRADWEAAMAVRTLSDHGALGEDARVLCVASDIPDSAYHLTRHVAEVIVAGPDGIPAGEHDTALQALFNTRAVVPFACRPDRMTVRRMDARALDYPDEFFDAIVSSVHVEDGGDRQDIAASASEMGRVLKPGGVLSLSADVLLSAEPGAASPGAGPLSIGDVQRYIVQASGLELLDEPDASVSHWTLSTSRDIAAAKRELRARAAALREGSPPPQWRCWELPHVVLEQGGRRYTSIHVALRRAAAQENAVSA